MQISFTNGPRSISQSVAQLRLHVEIMKLSGTDIQMNRLIIKCLQWPVGSKMTMFVSTFKVWYATISLEDSAIMESCLQHIVKTQHNSTKLNSTQSNCKSIFVGLDIVLTWNPPHPTPPHPKLFRHFQTSQRAEIWHINSLN